MFNFTDAGLAKQSGPKVGAQELHTRSTVFMVKQSLEYLL